MSKTCPPKELRKPRLGVPDSYSHDDHQSEDKLSWVHVTVGFQNHSTVQDEVGSALKEIQHYLHAKEFTTRISAIVDTKRRSAGIQDSQKKKVTITKDSFSALHALAGGHKKNKWMQELAGTKPLMLLLRNDKIPGFNKKEELLDSLCEYNVPMKRAVWFIKLTALYIVSLTESKVKRKHNSDLSHDLTADLTRYLQNCANKLCSKSKSVSELLLLLKPPNEEASADGQNGEQMDTAGNDDNGRRASISGSAGNELSEVTRWSYCTRLTDWLYHEGLLDRHKLLKWMVEKLEMLKTSNEAAQYLYLQLVIKYLSDISQCVSLSRPLVQFCLKKLNNLYKMSQRIESSGLLDKHITMTNNMSTTTSSSIHVKTEKEDTGGVSIKTEKLDELDSVFSPAVEDVTMAAHQTESGHGRSSIAATPDGTKIVHSRTAGDETQPIATSTSSHRNHTNKPSVATDQSGELTTVTMENTDQKHLARKQDSISLFTWCEHHQKLVGLLSCVVQTVALSCTTALVHLPLADPTSRLLATREEKDYSLLKNLQFSISHLPIPSGLCESRKRQQFMTSLLCVEKEARMRSLAAAGGWSSMSAPTTSDAGGGTIVMRLLEILDAFDKHSFHMSQWTSTVAVLYDKIMAVNNNGLLTPDVFAMLLCQWAVTSNREGLHRPLIVAQILEWRQQEILKGTSLCNSGNHGDEGCCPEMEATLHDTNDFPFHDILVKYLDTRAPLPSTMEKPLTAGDPFYQLVVLFGELIRRQIFCYEQYLSMLISRGDLQSPVVPKFSCVRHARATRTVSNDCQLPAAKKGKFDLPVSSLVSHKDNSSSTPGSNILTPQGSQLLTPGPVFSITPVLGSQMEVFTSAIDNMSPTFDLGPGNHGTGSSTSRPSQLPHQMLPGEQHGMGSDGSDVAILQERQRKLQQLIHEDSGRFPLIISPTDGTLSPSKSFAAKVEQFGFLPAGHTAELSSLSDDVTINVEAEKHGLYAANFPIPNYYLNRSDINERMTVLCGTGNARKKVVRVLEAISSNIEHFFNSLANSSTRLPAKYSKPELMRQFATLPVFHQRKIATTCECLMRKSLQGAGVNDIAGLSHYPHPAQFSFLCDLMETSGDISNIIELVVDVAACGSEEEKESFGVNPRPSPLPNDLCIPTVCILYKHFSSLLISQHYTTVIFENLCRVLAGLHEPNTTMSGAQRTVVYFLKYLYSSCRYLQKPFHSIIGEIQNLFPNIIQDSYAPITPESGNWSNRSSVLLAQLANPSYCNVQHLCNMLRTNPHSNVMFVCEAIYNACHIAVLDSVCDLVKICSEVCCAIPDMCGQLLGALKAICLPSRKPSCQHLVERVNLTDVQIHSKLVQFIALLLAHNCILMDDFIKHVIQKVLKTASANNDLILEFSLKFINSVVMILFVDQDSPTVDCHHFQSSEQLVLPSYVSHFLYASRRKVPFLTIIDLLKDIYKLTKGGKGSMISNKGSIQQGQSLSMTAAGISSRLISELDVTISCLASQHWLREKCLTHSDQLLEKFVADRVLTTFNVRYLLHLLCPLPNTAQAENGEAPSVSIEDILRNLDQWTLRTSLLHIDTIISHTPSQPRASLLESIAMNVIDLFEESCITDWVGPMEATVEQGDGAYSPAIWLITPLVSKLHAVLGKVLKNAGNVLGRGQWWNPEKIQEKRRSTRANSGAAQLRCSLQWQQPFLELVLVCMKSQKAAHDDLLLPLKQQLLTFLAAHEKEGPPADEQARMTLYAAIKLRLSLLGSMLSSVCINEATSLEWITLLMQLLCSGAIDRQPENSEVFTHALDMLVSLLNAMSGELLNTSAAEDVKRSSVVKKLMCEVTNAKSSCVDEIKQLFPVSLKKFEAVSVESPSWVQLGAHEKKRGLKVNDVKEISSWDLIEGVKTIGALPLSLYGGARVERRPLKYEEQFQLVQVHSHKQQLPTHNFVYIADQKDLPVANPPADGTDGVASQEGELGPTETLNSSSSEQSGSQDQVKKAQNNTPMTMPLQQRGDHMMQQPARVQMPPHMGAGVGMPSQLHPGASGQPTAAVVGNAAMGTGNQYSRHAQMAAPQQQGYNPSRMMATGSGFQQQMQKPSGFPPPPYHPQQQQQQPQRQVDMMQWSNAGQGGGVGVFESKRREQLKAIQNAAMHEVKRQQMLTPMQQGRGYGTTMGGQQMASRGMGTIQDFLNQFPADQRSAVYQQMLRKQRQQQIQALQQQQPQQQPHPGMAMGGAVRTGFVRQAYPNQIMMRQRVGMGYGGLQQQQARQQQLFQIQQQQQQFQQQHQFGGGAGYNQY